jgi:uncharacterized protein YjiS (DUF1127 family)
MTAQFAKDQMSYLAPASLSEAGSTVFAPTEQASFADRLRAAATWASRAMQRRAVVNELSALSDHELTDIGLVRSDIPRVFDPAFVASRGTPKAFQV